MPRSNCLSLSLSRMPDSRMYVRNQIWLFSLVILSHVYLIINQLEEPRKIKESFFRPDFISLLHSTPHPRA